MRSSKMCGAPSPRSGPYPPLQLGRQDPSKTRWTTDRQRRPARPFANWVPCNRLYPELQEAEIEGTKRQRYALTIRITGLSLTICFPLAIVLGIDVAVWNYSGLRWPASLLGQDPEDSWHYSISLVLRKRKALGIGYSDYWRCLAFNHHVTSR